VRVAILGDVHSNRPALEAILADARLAGAEAFLQVGDIVGYGPHPRDCIDILSGLKASVCMGNHDAAAVHLLPLDAFNPFARMALEWTQSELSRPHRDVLAGLPRSLASAARSLELQATTYCFVGHSHQPCLFAMDPEGCCEYLAEFRRVGFYRATDQELLLVNVGSVGQPRDEDPRAAYVLLDTVERSVRLLRVAYDIAGVQADMRKVGLPAVLADRLYYGL
jgi:diadenosine tetraphosphatase ApaH/serine/threonine PP2A family protein phosphatase